MKNDYPTDRLKTDTARTIKKLAAEQYISDISLHRNGMPVSLQKEEFTRELLDALESLETEHNSMLEYYESTIETFIERMESNGFNLTEADRQLLDVKNQFTENGIRQAETMRENDPEAFYTIFILENDQREYRVNQGMKEEGQEVR